MTKQATGLICPGCSHEIRKQEINDLLVDNRGAWHRLCFTPEPTTNEAARGVSLAA